MLIMGWDGTEVTPQIRSLIEQHHLGSILLTAKNLKCRVPAVIKIPYPY
jgi:beta-N-acetylhexosaminidase